MTSSIRTTRQLQQVLQVKRVRSRKVRFRNFDHDYFVILDVEMVFNIYRLEHGSYTMSDSQMAADAATNGYCLDLLLFFGELDDFPMEAGGYVSYFAVGDSNEVNFRNFNIYFCLVVACSSAIKLLGYCFPRARGVEFY